MSYLVKNPSICLNMIVKNESKTIGRLLKSVVPFITNFIIVDTGSTDNTTNIIIDFFEKHNKENPNSTISGNIFFEPFQNFSYNRNHALQLCKGLSDFILLLDADMILEFGPDFNKDVFTLKLLTHSAFQILQGDENFYYYNTRIIHNQLTVLTDCAKYIGVTHEYLSVPGVAKIMEIPKSVLFIRDIGDGGAKSDKYDRDIRLLTNGIEKEPENKARYLFYLANSYYDRNSCKEDNEEAIQHYKKRITEGGWTQEIWYSYLRLGYCYKRIGNISDAIYNWLEAYNYYPHRIENLYELVDYYTGISKHKLADVFYQLAKKVLITSEEVKHKDSFLFVNNDIYTHKLDFLYTIYSGYIGNKNINSEIVSIMNNANEHIIVATLLRNMVFYPNVLSTNKIISFDEKIEQKMIPDVSDLMPFWSSSFCIYPLINNYKVTLPLSLPLSNSIENIHLDISEMSEPGLENIIDNTNTIDDIMEFINKENIKETKNVIETENEIMASSNMVLNDKVKYVGNIRFVNYKIDKRDGSYEFPNNPKSQIITMNKYVELDENLDIIRSKWIIPEYEPEKRYLGMEDIRIYPYDLSNTHIPPQYMFFGTSTHKTDKIGMFFGMYPYTPFIERPFIGCEIKPEFNAEESNVCEKNWVFIPQQNTTTNNELSSNPNPRVVYKWNPLQICEIVPSIKTNNAYSLIMKESKSMPRIFSYARGSTSGFLSKENEIWFVVHLVSYESPRHYYHMIVVFDKDMNLQRYSAPFKFPENQPIEYCLSLVVEEDQILIGYSCWDNSSKLAVYEKQYIESQLVYKP